MRRRLDIPPLPFLCPDGAMHQLTSDGSLVPFISEAESDGQGGDGRELGAMPSSFLSVSHDYVARSRYLAGTPNGTDTPVDNEHIPAQEMRRAITKLERAVMELRTGMLGAHPSWTCVRMSDPPQVTKTSIEGLRLKYS